MWILVIDNVLDCTLHDVHNGQWRLLPWSSDNRERTSCGFITLHSMNHITIEYYRRVIFLYTVH
jgi:hypothetical protein